VNHLTVETITASVWLFGAIKVALHAGRYYLGRLQCCLVSALLLTGAPPALAKSPNEIVILADDVGWGDLHANNPASKVPTPNLDDMARKGIRFTNVHTSGALCAPSRYSGLTGNYHWRGRHSWGMSTHYEPSQLLEGQQTLALLWHSGR
jgi:arylsulfatase A